ncbi:MAG: iron ABC transporter permease [Clostridia bacterium]|nr:iron ABC transporter permease [Clostridia bacterium]
MKAERVWKLDFKWLIILLIVDFLLVFQVLPTVNMVVKAFFPESRFSLSTITRLYTYDLNLSALKNTLIAATCTMILGTLLAFPLAWLVGRTNLYGKRFFRSLFVLTYMVPPYVGAMAWLRLLNPNVGNINLALRAVFGLGDAPGPLNIYSLPGLVWVLTTFYYPYAFITVSRAMEKMDPSLEEASRISGASPLKTVAKITFPMMTPSLIAGALLVFVSAASCYGIPSIIGAPGRVHTVTTRIIDYVGRGSEGMNDATGLGVFLMVIAIIILYISDFVVAKRQYITVSGKSTTPNIVDLGKWRAPITALVSLFAVIVILIPFATILITSFKVDLGKSLLDEGNFTFKQWTTIFSYDEMIECLKNSFIFAIITATIGIVVACTMSYLLQRTTIRGRKLPDFLITLGSGTPSVVIALSLILSMRGDFGINIYKTAYIMIIAYTIKYLMMGMRTVVSAMSQIHISLEECSQISGATWLKTMFKITGPLIFPSIAAGWFLIFIPSFYELSMTTLLYGNGTKTIGFELYEYWTFTSQPMACAMAFAILMIVVVLNFVLNKLTKGEFSI